jgi:hypothetical protein
MWQPSQKPAKVQTFKDFEAIFPFRLISLRRFEVFFSFFWSESVRNGQNRSEISQQFRVGGTSYFFGRNRSKRLETGRKDERKSFWQGFGKKVSI